MTSKSNGGFPPLRIIKKEDIKKEKKEKTYKLKKDVHIKNILSDSIVKPMIEINKPKNDIVVDFL
jgi:hypothetical protein